MSLLCFFSAGDSFVRLFTEMDVLSTILFLLGIIFCAIEMVVPGIGFFGYSGIALTVVGVVVRMINGGDLWMLLFMLLIALALFCVMFVVASRLITKGRLSKTPLFSVNPTVSEEKTDGTKDFSLYLGKVGVAATSLHPVGKAAFGGDVLDVVARDGFVDKGEEVLCVHVEGQRVVVIENPSRLSDPSDKCDT